MPNCFTEVATTYLIHSLSGHFVWLEARQLHSLLYTRSQNYTQQYLAHDPSTTWLIKLTSIVGFTPTRSLGSRMDGFYVGSSSYVPASYHTQNRIRDLNWKVREPNTELA